MTEIDTARPSAAFLYGITVGTALGGLVHQQTSFLHVAGVSFAAFAVGYVLDAYYRQKESEWNQRNTVPGGERNPD